DQCPSQTGALDLLSYSPSLSTSAPYFANSRRETLDPPASVRSALSVTTAFVRRERSRPRRPALFVTARLCAT
ncbi:hypothetical protein FA15DRAFT_711612, partial [Coprinopsis marcescibilis]